MIPIPAKIKAVLGVLLVGAIASLQALGHLSPTWAWAGAVAQVLTALELYLTTPALAAALLLVMAASSSVACSAAQQQQTTVDVGALAACVLTTVTADVAAKKPWTACVEDAVTRCGTDAATVVSIYASHVRAEVAEGKTPIVPVGLTDAGAP